MKTLLGILAMSVMFGMTGCGVATVCEDGVCDEAEGERETTAARAWWTDLFDPEQELFAEGTYYPGRGVDGVWRQYNRNVWLGLPAPTHRPCGRGNGIHLVCDGQKIVTEIRITSPAIHGPLAGTVSVGGSMAEAVPFHGKPQKTLQASPSVTVFRYPTAGVDFATTEEDGEYTIIAIRIYARDFSRP